MINHYIKTMVKGLLIGATMLVPGVSGGSMAMILGVYDKLISAVSSFMKDIRKNFLFLLLFLIGGLSGMVLFAKPLLGIIERYPLPMMYFFIGAVAGGVPLMYKKAELKRVSAKAIIGLLSGVLMVLLLNLIPSNTFGGNSNSIGITISLIAGFIAAIALVLPGISVSYMLLLMGIYDKVIDAIGSLKFGILLPLGIGLLVGIIATTKILETAMTRFPQVTYMVILGFVIGSVMLIFPGIPSGVEWIICLCTLTAGFVVIYALSRMEGKNSIN